MLYSAILSKSYIHQISNSPSQKTQNEFDTEDDCRSMIAHRDVCSIPSIQTTSAASSSQSRVFDFDHELFTTGIYEKWIRGSVKSALRKQQDRELSSQHQMGPAEIFVGPTYELWQNQRLRMRKHRLKKALDDERLQFSMYFFGNKQCRKCGAFARLSYTS